MLLNIRKLAVRMDRTFQHRFTLGAACGIVLLLLATLYAFWMLKPVVGVLLALGLVMVMEQSLHKQYIFRDDKLIIDNGRLMKNRVIALSQISSCRPMTTTFGMVHYLLISDGAANTVVAVQPRNEQAFINCLRQRREEVMDAEQTHGEADAEQPTDSGAGTGRMTDGGADGE